MKPRALVKSPTPSPIDTSEASGIRVIAPPEEGADRRASPRVKLETDVSLTSESQFFSGLTGDISEGGLFVATYRVLPVGASVEIELTLLDVVIRAVGRVRWVRPSGLDQPPGIGIELVSIADEGARYIQRFCAARPPLYVDD